MFGMQMGQMGLVGQMPLAQRIAYMFAHGEQGAWYDPSDLSTLFQDEAGAIPVTAVEQPVGRILDKSGRGNHATQATTTKRPVYSRRVNLLLNSEISDAVPGNPGASPSAWGNSATSGEIAYDSFGLVFASSAGQRAIFQSIVTRPNTDYLFEAKIKTYSDFRPHDVIGSFGPGFSSAQFALNKVAVSGGSIVTPGEYDISLTITSNAEGGELYLLLGVGLAGYISLSCSFKDASLCLATDAHLPYQRVNTDTDYDADPAKFPAYLRFDGVDDAMQTGNIDFTGTDKMTVWAGFLNTGTTGYHLFSEFGLPASGDQGAFSHFAALDAVGRVVIASKAGASEGMMRFPPVTPSILDITTYALDASKSVPAEAVPIFRKNSQEAVKDHSGTFSTAAGWGNHPLYIGARAGTSLYFNGRLYSLIARGAQSSLSQIEVVETLIRQKMRLP